MDPTLARVIVLPTILIFAGIILFAIAPMKWREQRESGESGCLTNIILIVVFGGFCAVATFALLQL